MEISECEAATAEEALDMVNTANSIYEHPRVALVARNLGELPHPLQDQEVTSTFGHLTGD
jgi:hypothetical protein